MQQNLTIQTKTTYMRLTKQARADVLPVQHSSLNPPTYNLDYIKVNYCLYKK